MGSPDEHVQLCSGGLGC